MYEKIYEEIKHHPEVLGLIKKGNENLRVLGYTDHSVAHTGLVAHRAGEILSSLRYSRREIFLAKTAGFMHDIGNCINRKCHAEYGGLLANDILKETSLSVEDRLTVVSAISHHDETTGGAKDIVSAALIIADKTDVRRSRVCDEEEAFDIHDRVNYAVTENRLVTDADQKEITLHLTIDENFCTMYEYFDIFLQRMLMSRSAAEMLSTKFSLNVNGNKVL